MHDTLDRDLVKIKVERAVGVIKNKLNPRAPRARRAPRTIPYQILAALAAHALHRLLAEHKAERLRDIALARAVGADDGRDGGDKLQRGLFGKRLKPR